MQLNHIDKTKCWKGGPVKGLAPAYFFPLIGPASLPLPVMVPTLNVATLSLIFLVFFHSSFLSFFLLHCFPPLLCIQVACPPVALAAQSLVTVVVIPSLDRSGVESDTTRIENIWLGFTPDTLPIYPGLGSPTRLLRFEQPYRLVCVIISE